MSLAFETKMKELVEGTPFEFKKCTEYHYQLKGIFLINIYPTKNKYYTQGSENGIRYSSIQDLVDICTGDKNMPKAKDKTTRRHLSNKKPTLWKQSKHCFFCGVKISSLAEATVEHKIPLSRGGSNRIDNLALSHDECNQKRKNDLQVEISVKEKQLIDHVNNLQSKLSAQNEIIEKMEKALGFYGKPSNWDDRIFLKEYDESKTEFSDYSGGKLARATLKEVEEIKKKMGAV